MNRERQIVQVELISPELKAKYGPRTHVGWVQAVRGEQAGKWRILPDDLAPGSAGRYETREMVAVKPHAHESKTTTEPRSLRKTRVAWVMDRSRTGGAELSCDTAIRVGTDCGFEIEMLTPREGASTIFDAMIRADVSVLNNLWEFAPGQVDAVRRATGRGLPYVKWEHDHRELTRLPFSGPLFRAAALCVFLSPAHLERHRAALELEPAKCVALPLAIDPDAYAAPAGVERAAATALVSNVRNFKTWHRLQAFIHTRPETVFTVLTDNGCPVQGPNVKIHSIASPGEMPRIYAQHETLVHLLDGLGAGERVIFEAALCGCRVVSDDHAGHMTWKRDLSDGAGLRDWLRAASYEFWRHVDRVVR